MSLLPRQPLCVLSACLSAGRSLREYFLRHLLTLKIGNFLFLNLELNLSMLRRLYFLGPKIAYSFPVQLLLNNLKRNQVLLLCWIIVFAMITGSFGKYLGIP